LGKKFPKFNRGGQIMGEPPILKSGYRAFGRGPFWREKGGGGRKYCVVEQGGVLKKEGGVSPQ